MVFNRRGGLGLQSRVFKPGELFGLTWGQIREFDDYNEAQNFSNYINTMIIARLAYLDYSRTTFGSFIPELNDYSDNNPLFQTDDELGENHEYFGLTLNERLYKLFKLTKDEIAIVENV